VKLFEKMELGMIEFSAVLGSDIEFLTPFKNLNL
jgi:hypothetical protein